MFALCPHDVGVILGYGCPNACRHCLYNCAPRRKAVMTEETLRAALESLTVYPQLPQVHLTGGEPFLHFDLLLEGARVASELGITAYLETGAAWCTDEEVAAEHFRALREAGLHFVLISCSPFHAERTPPARTARAIRAAVRSFGPQRVIVYQQQFMSLMEQFGAEHTTPLERYVETYGVAGARRILWEGFGIISGGRAGYRLGDLAVHRPPESFAGATCTGELLYASHSHIDLHGDFVPAFCGGIAVGRWRELPQLLAEFHAGEYPPLIAKLIARGPYGLYRWAAQTYGYAPRPEGYAGKCHLCVDVRRHLVAVADFPELRPRAFYENF